MMRELRWTSHLIGAVLLSAATVCCAARPPVSACPDVAGVDAFDPSDPDAARKLEKNAPPLFLALAKGNHDTLRGSLARGEDPNACAMGVSVVGYAVAAGDAQAVRILLDNGATPDMPRDSTGGTPLQFALELGRFDIARELLDRGADAAAVSSGGGKTTLMQLAVASVPPAAHGQALELARLLIRRGADVNAQMRIPRTTALILATVKQDRDLVLLLLENGADPGLQNSRGETALSFARKKDNAEIVKMLEAAAAKESGR